MGEVEMKLKKGDKIGIYSPSAPITATAPKRYARAKCFLEEKGFEMVEGSLTGKYDHYRSGLIRARAAELNDLLRAPDIKMIMSAIGGSNANALGLCRVQGQSENYDRLLGHDGRSFGDLRANGDPCLLWTGARAVIR